MRIAQVTPVYPPYRGGMGTVAAEYTRLLREAGDEVTVFSPIGRSSSPPFMEGKGVELLRPLLAYGHGAILPQLLWRLRGFDVIHLHYPFFGSDFLVALAAKIWRVPLVVTFHMRPKASGWLGWIFRVYRFYLEGWILGSARAVLVSSKDYADSVGLQHPRLFEMPFGINTNRFSPKEKEFVSKELTILFVGGLDKAHYFKGLEVLLEAMRSVDARLVIVGSGSEKGRYEELARSSGVVDRVTFAGSVPFEVLPEMYRAADIHVLPSIDRSEAWGLVTLEAAASRIPSIVSDLPGVRTVIVPGETGLLVPPGSAHQLAAAMQYLAQEVELRKKMGKQARVRAEKCYDDRVLIKRLREIYETGKLPSI